MPTPPERVPTGPAAEGREERSGLVGRVIDGRYRIVDRLGEGGMGAVFVAEHLKLGKRVAIKTIQAELAGQTEIANRFAREAMATARIDHPHVASAIDFGTLEDGTAYLVTQLVRGEDLRTRIERAGKVPWPVACAIAAEISDALAAAHAAGIVHRDLKPENVMIERRDDGTEHVKVLDFGIAHVAIAGMATPAKAGTQLTRLGTILGTPGYMAPEQCIGERVDHRADLYALGVVLFEMLVGRVPFENKELTELITLQLTETPPRVRSAGGAADIPAALEELVVGLLARSPSGRPDRAAAVRDALLTLVVTADTRSLPIGLVTATPAPIGTTAARDWRRGVPDAALDAARARLKRVPLLATAPLVLVVAACLVASVLGTVVTALVAGDGDVVTAAKPPKPQRRAPRPSRRPEPPDAPVPVAPSPASDLDALVDTLVHGEDREARRDAARAIAERGDAPEYARLAAELELARRCREKREVLARIRDAADPRSLPVVERLVDLPTNGCGFLGLRDCWSCLRAPARATVSDLRERR